MKTKEILTEWKSFLEKELLNEISIKRFQEQYPEFNTEEFDSTLRGNADYLQVIANSIDDGQQHSPDDYAQQFKYYKASIEKNRSNQSFLKIQVPGEEKPVSLVGKLNSGSYTATFNDIQAFQQARIDAGKGSKESLRSVYENVINEASESDFELVTEDSNWIIFYPKTIRGSIALAKSYWDGNKIVYDNTFSPSRGFGQNTGKINWCTSVLGSGNMFLNYHRRLNLHMYYCIKKNISDINDPGRKICVSFSKKNKKIKLVEGSASVDGDNSGINAEKVKSYLGNLFSIIEKDVEKDSRLEIDEKSYYTSISLDQYITLRRANEENINDFIPELQKILYYSKESEKIFEVASDDPSPSIKKTVASSRKLPVDIARILVKDKSTQVRAAVADNINIPVDVLVSLANDKSIKVREAIARSSRMPANVLEDLANDTSSKVRFSLSYNPEAPSEALRILAKDELTKIRYFVAAHSNTSIEDLQRLAKDDDKTVAEVAIEQLKSKNISDSVLIDYIKLILS